MPLVTSDVPGREFLLSAEDLGSLDTGSPVYYRRIPVGRVIGYAMRENGQGVDVRIFVDAPYDRFVTERSRFWQASGISLAMSAKGVCVVVANSSPSRVTSLSSLRVTARSHQRMSDPSD